MNIWRYEGPDTHGRSYVNFVVRHSIGKIKTRGRLHDLFCEIHEDCMLAFHVITASRGVGFDWRTLLVVPSTSNARISLPGWSRYVSGARLDFLVGFTCKMVFDASTFWQVRGAMHTMSISSPLKDYTLPNRDITTLTKQRDDPLQDRCTRTYISYPLETSNTQNAF